MAYHDSEKLALAALREIGERSPADLEFAQQLYEHYTPEANSDYPRLHAALVLLIEKDATKAVDRLLAERSPMYNEAALGLITGAIDNGPESWKADKEAIYGFGFFHLRNRFLAVRPGLEKGGRFDQTCRMVRPAYQPILEEAIYLALTNSPKAEIPFGTKLLLYVPVQLLPPSTVRDFKMDALALRHPDVDNSARRYTERMHADNIEKSANAVIAIAEKLKIAFPADQLARTNFTPTRSAAAPKPTRDFKRQRAETANSNVPVEDATVLNRTLKDLVKEEKVSLEEARIYFYLRTGKVIRTSKEAAEHFKKPQPIISTMYEKVANVLRRLDANLHQSRCVRPE